jgi:hypothetical protein
VHLMRVLFETEQAFETDWVLVVSDRLGQAGRAVRWRGVID